MTASHQTHTENSASAEGLPNSFIKSMSTLFDIMDDRKTGYVRFTDIEKRWHEDGTQGLPRGVLSSLRKVTPPNGYLSFDRFCMGLKISLLENKNGAALPMYVEPLAASITSASSANSLENVLPAMSSSPQISPNEKLRPLSAPLLDEAIYAKKPTKFQSFAPPPPLNKKPLLSPKHPLSYAKKSQTTKNKSDDRQNDTTKLSVKMETLNKVANGHSSRAMQGPPKPPRAVELDRNNEIAIESNRSTHSLERESRSNKRNVDNQNIVEKTAIRRERGGSLERLLDAGGGPPSKTFAPPHTLNKTGMRSALQTWFKEKSKSDLQKGDTNNNYHTIHKFEHNRYSEYGKNKSRPPPINYYENKVRSSGDGIDTNRPMGNKHYSAMNSYASTSKGSIHPTSQTNPSISTVAPAQQNELNEAMYIRTVIKPALPPPMATYNVQAYNKYNDTHSSNSRMQPKAHGKYVAPPPSQIAINKKTKKKEPRRHTLQNGIDYNNMRRMQQLEAERDMLYQGLDVVERARVWYKQQLSAISERILYLPLSPTKEPKIDTQREKMHFQLARIHEINAHLQALMDPEKSMQSMNLAIRSSSALPTQADDLSVKKVKEQNELLTKEVGMKNSRITALEAEKAALLRELFQARASTQNPSVADSFM